MCARFASSASSSAAAPSLMPEALPAVTVPPGRTTGFKVASVSIVVARGCSSRATMIGSPFFWTMATGAISASNRPAVCAASALDWLANAILSWSRRLMPNSAATFSAVSGIESTPYCAFMTALTKRQPMVVSSIFMARAKALSAFPITNGARLMLSTPPAMSNPASPLLIARAAVPTASRPEPHRRLSVTPGTATGKPASKPAMRATLRLSSPAWLAQPRKRSSTASQSTCALRAMSARRGMAPRSSARMPARLPP